MSLNLLGDETILKLGSILARGQATKPSFIDIVIGLSCKLNIYLLVNQPIRMARGFEGHVCVCVGARAKYMGF